MRSPRPPSQAPPGPVRQLTFSTQEGKPYERRADVEAEIGRALAVPRADWVQMAKTEGQDRLSSEALVFLTREVRHSDHDLFGQLVEQLSRRVKRIAARWARGFDPQTTEDILLQVELRIIERLLAEPPSRQSEFLEIAFGSAVKARTINVVAQRKQDPLSLLGAALRADGEEEEPERPMELVPDERPGPDEIVSEIEDRARTRQLVATACAAVADPRHLKALILHKIRGWPLYDQDPAKPTLAVRFGRSPRQIQNWINGALKAMRAAIGDTR
jgi:hypothetical protein